jgi:SAM-dependent methyltransferase
MTTLLASSSAPRSERFWPVLAATTIFLAAFLLFQVELLIAKLILPWFGGSAAVWLACLLFFQVALLCGYFYAHLLANRLTPEMQFRVHSVALIASLAFLPIIPSEFWKPSGGEDPLLLILGLLGGTIGLPFLLLSSATPLLQAWMARASIAQSPFPDGGARHAIYRLYALSNLGSMLALLSYPLLVEPWLPTRLQAWLWSAAYMIFAMLGMVAAWRQRATTGRVSSRRTTPLELPAKFSGRCLWVLLPAAASALLLAMSNHVLRNVAAIPLFWVVPLALYLLSFIIAFDHPRWYLRPLWLVLFAVSALMLSRILIGILQPQDIRVLLALYSAGLFVFCMVCHGELARLKPAPQHLTSYYLSISAGGAAGGIFVALLAPMLFRADFDLMLLLPATAVVIIAAVWLSRPRATEAMKARADLFILAGALLATGILALAMARREYANFTDHVYLERNFYGPLDVQDTPIIRTLSNGNIVHGREYVSPGLYSEPISYYSRGSGVGTALIELGKNGPLHVGAIGLGAGAVAGYARPGDTYRFYEINPAVADIATRFFHYLEYCENACEVVLGDARLSLEREEPQQFDLLAVDAFSGDSIPAHLLTREAFDLYWRHLKPGGVLAVHTSNAYIDLPPVVALAAERGGKIARSITGPGDDVSIDPSQWILVTANPAFFSGPLLGNANRIAVPPDLRAWTDDYSNLWRSMR